MQGNDGRKKDSLARKAGAVSGEAALTCKLARQAMARWQPEAERLRQLAAGRSPGQRRQALLEAQLALDQIDVFVRRIQPLLRAPEAAVRQEAEVLLTGIDALKDRLAAIADGPAAEPGQVASTAAPLPPLRDASGGQVTRFEPRYLDHLAGRLPGRQEPVAATSPPAVFETAYRLWLQDGQPAGRADFYWREALDAHWQQRAWDSATGIDAVPAARLRLGGGPEEAGAFADLAATLESLVGDAAPDPAAMDPSPEASHSDAEAPSPDADAAAAAPEPASPELGPRRQRARYVKGQGIVWTDATAADAPPAPPPRPAPMGSAKARPGNRKKGWGGA